MPKFIVVDFNEDAVIASGDSVDNAMSSIDTLNEDIVSSIGAEQVAVYKRVNGFVCNGSPKFISHIPKD